MFNGPLKSLSKKMLDWQGRAKSQTEVLDFALELSKIRTGLIILPDAKEEVIIALKKVLMLTKIFKNTNFRFLIKQEQATYLPSPITGRALIATEDSTSMMGVPTKAFIKKIHSEPVDILIDLNDQFNLFATNLTSKSNAKLRVCLSHPSRDAFYNFQVRTSMANQLEAKYDVLVKYLSITISGQPTQSPSMQPA